MKGLIIAMILSAIFILLGGFILCFPHFIPVAITLMSFGGFCFVVFGCLAVATKCNYFD